MGRYSGSPAVDLLIVIICGNSVTPTIYAQCQIRSYLKSVFLSKFSLIAESEQTRDNLAFSIRSALQIHVLFDLVVHRINYLHEYKIKY